MTNIPCFRNLRHDTESGAMRVGGPYPKAGTDNRATAAL